ncbi:MAG: nucleotide exchange factor GrpE [Candidatus Syntropharchaeia archaeon]
MEIEEKISSLEKEVSEKKELCEAKLNELIEIKGALNAIEMELKSKREQLKKEGDETEIIDDLEILENEIREKSKLLGKEDEKAKEYLSRLQYLQADFENYKKRMEKEKKEIVESATENLIIKLLDIMDNFQRAIDSAKNTKDWDALMKGIEMVFAQFRNVLEKEGVREIEAVGCEFDPYKHEAVGYVSSEDEEEGTIVEELRKGYMLHSKVIRPSLVKVIKND